MRIVQMVGSDRAPGRTGMAAGRMMYWAKLSHCSQRQVADSLPMLQPRTEVLAEEAVVGSPGRIQETCALRSSLDGDEGEGPPGVLRPTEP